MMAPLDTLQRIQPQKHFHMFAGRPQNTKCALSCEAINKCFKTYIRRPGKHMITQLAENNHSFICVATPTDNMWSFQCFETFVLLTAGSISMRCSFLWVEVQPSFPKCSKTNIAEGWTHIWSVHVSGRHTNKHYDTCTKQSILLMVSKAGQTNTKLSSFLGMTHDRKQQQTFKTIIRPPYVWMPE